MDHWSNSCSWRLENELRTSKDERRRWKEHFDCRIDKNQCRICKPNFANVWVAFCQIILVLSFLLPKFNVPAFQKLLYLLVLQKSILLQDVKIYCLPRKTCTSGKSNDLCLIWPPRIFMLTPHLLKTTSEKSNHLCLIWLPRIFMLTPHVLKRVFFSFSSGWLASTQEQWWTSPLSCCGHLPPRCPD